MSDFDLGDAIVEAINSDKGKFKKQLQEKGVIPQDTQDRTVEVLGARKVSLFGGNISR